MAGVGGHEGVRKEEKREGTKKKPRTKRPREASRGRRVTREFRAKMAGFHRKELL